MKFLKKLLQRRPRTEATADKSGAEAIGPEEKTLLICQRCRAEFTDHVDTRLTGDAASLPAALKAHRTGWVVADGEILCPDCGSGQVPKLH